MVATITAATVLLVKNPVMRSSVALAYPATVGIEYLLLSRYVPTDGGSISALPFVLVGDITYVYLIILIYTTYVLCGMAKVANKETEPQLPKATAHFMKSKEKMLLIMILSTVCMIILAIYHGLHDKASIAVFVVTEFIFAVVLFGFISVEGMNILKREIKKRLEADKGIKESQVCNEEESKTEA